MVVKRNESDKYSAQFIGQEVTFSGLGKMVSQPLSHINNAAAADEEFVRNMQSVAGYTVQNYLSIPRKEAGVGKKDKRIDELMIFMNKRIRKGDPATVGFTKTDEALGQLASHIYSVIEAHHDAMMRLDREKEFRRLTYYNAEELVSCVT